MWPKIFHQFELYRDLVENPHPVVRLSALAHHSVFRANLYGKSWIVKPVENSPYSLLEVERELLCQNFFRLIIPHQPDTRLCLRKTYFKPEYYILSEEVQGFRPLPAQERASPVYGDYSGLGQALVVALLLQDRDVKNGNIGINQLRQVIKIDGDCSFSGLTPEKKGSLYRVTADVIESLPDLVFREYWAFNWLDYVQENQYYGHSKLVHPHLSNDPCFRREVNQAILRVVLLTSLVLQKFVDAYVTDGTRQREFLYFLIGRRDELLQAALQSESFCHYVGSQEAKADTAFFSQNVRTFTAHREVLLSSDAYERSFLRRLTIRQNDLLGQALFSSLDRFPIDEDPFLSAYLREIKCQLRVAQTDDQFLAIHMRLRGVLTFLTKTLAAKTRAPSSHKMHLLDRHPDRTIESLSSQGRLRSVEQRCQKLLAMISPTDADSGDFLQMKEWMLIFQRPTLTPIQLLQVESRIDNGVISILLRECRQHFIALQPMTAIGDESLYREMEDINQNLLKTIHHSNQLLTLRRRLRVIHETIMAEDWRRIQEQRKVSLISACQLLLEQITSVSVPEDRVLCAVRDECSIMISEEDCSIKTLLERESYLQKIVQQVLAPEIQRIKASIDGLSARGGVWGDLAKTLRDDFYNTSLEKRSLFLYRACDRLLEELRQYHCDNDRLLRHYLTEMQNKLSQPSVQTQSVVLPLMRNSTPLVGAETSDVAAESVPSELIISEPRAFFESAGGIITPVSQHALCEMWVELSLTFRSINSPEVVAVKEIIRQWEQKAQSGCAPWVKSMRYQRAKALELAFFSIPLLERGSVISGPENDVQRSLVTHPTCFGRGKVYRNSAGQIDEARAPRYFVTLRHTLFAPPAPSAMEVREVAVVSSFHSEEARIRR